MIPFLRFGEFITGGPHFPLTSDALKKVFAGQASWEVLQSIFHAVCNQVSIYTHINLLLCTVSEMLSGYKMHENNVGHLL